MTDAMGGRVQKVTQLRVVVEADDYDEAVRFYRDILSVAEIAAFSEGGDDRVAILEAGRATFEVASPAHREAIDWVEADGIPSPKIRIAFEVEDSAASTRDAEVAGGCRPGRACAHPVEVTQLPARGAGGSHRDAVRGDQGRTRAGPACRVRHQP